MAEAAASIGRLCASCGTELSAIMIACPACFALVHAAELKQLSARAKEEEARGELQTAVATLTAMAGMIPANTKQAEAVLGERARLVAQAGAGGTKSPLPAWAKRLGPIGVVLVFILTKGKLLLLGLTKLSTVLTMLASFGLYARLWGVWFAAGFIISIYIHEMGHVAALRAAGIPASAPMFIPGFGALVRLNMRPPDAVTDARIGLAGPVWGLGAALAFLALGKFLPDVPALLAIGTAGARINLFNLIPVWQLDGSRGVQPLNRLQRALLGGLLLALFVLTQEGMLVLVGLVMAWRIFEKDQPREGHWPTFATFAALLVALSLATFVHVPLPG